VSEVNQTSSTGRTRPRTRVAPANPVGARVRALRVEAGLTQAELAGDRFTKEYVSQVELGKTRPSAAALEWMAARLATSVEALTGQPDSAAREACEAAVARVEAEIEAHRHPEAAAAAEQLTVTVAALGDDRLTARHALANGWAVHHLGRLDEGLAELARGREAAERCGDQDAVALALYRMGMVRFKLGSLVTAAGLMEEALRACDASASPSDALRARIYNGRAKIRQRQKDFTAAAEDVQLALDLAASLGDDRVLAETLLDASLVAERRGEYTAAREHAERARALFERISDREYVGKLLNNLGWLRALGGNPEQAVPLLRESFRIAVELDNRVDAAFAASSLASARLHCGDLDGAIESGNTAMELLGGREEYRQEEGNARVVIGRAHLQAGRIDAAEQNFTAAVECYAVVESVSHLAGAWMGLGDVAEARGDSARAAELYRRAAEALQDVRW